MIMHVLLALLVLLTPLYARASDTVLIVNVLAQPEAFHARTVLFSGTVRDVTILPQTDEDIRLNRADGGTLDLPQRCYFVHPAYQFTLDDGTGALVISVRPRFPCVPGQPPLAPLSIEDGDIVSVDTFIQIKPVPQGASLLSIEAIASRIIKNAHQLLH